MPVARGPKVTARSMVVVGGAGVVAAAVLMAFVIWIIGQGDHKVDIRLGDDRFGDINADRMAKRIAAEGPVLFPDLSANGTRDVYVQHLGADPKTGWLVFDARLPGANRDCYLVWSQGDLHFVDKCTGVVVPAGGGDQRSYAVTVANDGKVVVDLNASPPARATTAPSR